MNQLIISEISLFVVAIISVLICIRFMSLKESEFMDIMIYYFGLEFFIYIMTVVFLYTKSNYFPYLSLDYFRMGVLLPKALIMIKLFIYLKNKK